MGKDSQRRKIYLKKKLGSVQWAAWPHHTPFISILNIRYEYREHSNDMEVQRGSTDTPRRRDGPWSRVWTRTLRGLKLMQLRSGGSVSSGPLPLINHSNYLPQPQECAGRAAPWPLLRWEALWGLGGSTNLSQLTLKKKKRKRHLSMKLQEFNSTASPSHNGPLPFHSALCPFGFICIWEFIKTGSAKRSVSVQHLFYKDFGKGTKSPSHRVKLRASYLIMLISRELLSEACLPVPIFLENITLNVHTCSIVAP